MTKVLCPGARLRDGMTLRLPSCLFVKKTQPTTLRIFLDFVAIFGIASSAKFPILVYVCTYIKKKGPDAAICTSTHP